MIFYTLVMFSIWLYFTIGKMYIDATFGVEFLKY